MRPTLGEPGWRQVKLYFMWGLPTETDADVLQIAELAKRVIETGRRVSGRRDIRCTVSIGGFVPKPRTPFQWCSQLGVEEIDARLHDAEAALADEPVDVAWYTTHERDQAEVLPWDHLDSGLDKDWPWEDRQDIVADLRRLDDALDETVVDDCRWTPCFDCGVCPQRGTAIEIGPTGKTLLPLTVLGAPPVRSSSSTSTDALVTTGVRVRLSIYGRVGELGWGAGPVLLVQQHQGFCVLRK